MRAEGPTYEEERKGQFKKPVRWSLIVVGGVFGSVCCSIALIVASNLGGGLLDLVLNRRPTAAELTGDYRLNVSWGRSSLHINPDGTFEQAIEENGKPTRSISGRWLATNVNNSVDVDFSPFEIVWDEDHERETNIYRIDFYKSHFGSTYGTINDDLGEKYERQQGDKHGR